MRGARPTAHQMAMAVAYVFACRSPSTKPQLDQSSILGDWELWCATSSETDVTCLGKDPSGNHHVFKPDGTVQWWDHDNEATRSTSDWTLEGDQLTLFYRNAGARDVSRARLVDRALVLWDPEHRTSRIYGRHGDRLPYAPSVVSDGTPIEHELRGIRYRLALPDGYRLGLDDPDRQRWEHEGDGFVYLVFVDLSSPLCPDDGKLHDHGGWGGEHAYGIRTSVCMPNTKIEVECEAGHTRGYLEASEHAAAREVCRTIAIISRP